jgi:hypothetical protein
LLSGLLYPTALAVFSRHHHNRDEDDDDWPCDLHENVREDTDRSQKEIEPKDKQEHGLYHVMAAVACFALRAHFVIFHFCI